jgi:hypothetical protein
VCTVCSPGVVSRVKQKVNKKHTGTADCGERLWTPWAEAVAVDWARRMAARVARWIVGRKKFMVVAGWLLYYNYDTSGCFDFGFMIADGLVL